MIFENDEHTQNSTINQSSLRSNLKTQKQNTFVLIINEHVVYFNAEIEVTLIIHVLVSEIYI